MEKIGMVIMFIFGKIAAFFKMALRCFSSPCLDSTKTYRDLLRIKSAANLVGTTVTGSVLNSGTMVAEKLVQSSAAILTVISRKTCARERVIAGMMGGLALFEVVVFIRLLLNHEVCLRETSFKNIASKSTDWDSCFSANLSETIFCGFLTIIWGLAEYKKAPYVAVPGVAESTIAQPPIAIDDDGVPEVEPPKEAHQEEDVHADEQENEFAVQIH